MYKSQRCDGHACPFQACWDHAVRRKFSGPNRQGTPGVSQAVSPSQAKVPERLDTRMTEQPKGYDDPHAQAMHVRMVYRLKSRGPIADGREQEFPAIDIFAFARVSSEKPNLGKVDPRAPYAGIKSFARARPTIMYEIAASGRKLLGKGASRFLSRAITASGKRNPCAKYRRAISISRACTAKFPARDYRAERPFTTANS